MIVNVHKLDGRGLKAGERASEEEGRGIKTAYMDANVLSLSISRVSEASLPLLFTHVPLVCSLSRLKHMRPSHPGVVTCYAGCYPLFFQAVKPIAITTLLVLLPPR